MQAAILTPDELRAADQTLAAAPAPHERAPIPALDGVRGLAILLVMLCHLYHGPEKPANFLEQQLMLFTNAGWCGVELFFVLSGFLITGILWDARGTQHYFRSFYARRTLRIFPLYYGFLLVIILFAAAAGERNPDNIKFIQQNQAWYWTYMTNMLIVARNSAEAIPRWASPLWSLSVEEQFYLVWPLVVWRLQRTTLMRICAASLVFSLLVRVAMHRMNLSLSAVYVFTPARVDVLLVGAFLALYLRGGPPAPRDLRRMRIVMAASAAALLFFYCTRRGLRNMDAGMQTYGTTTLALLFGGLVFHAAAGPAGGWTAAIFACPLLRWAGKYSYGMYIFHFPVQRLLSLLTTRHHSVLGMGSLSVPLALSHLAVCILATALLAFASYQLFEKRFLRLKRFVPYA